MNEKARYIMIGGFLGAGKTTTIIRLAQYLQQRDIKTGLITNDQSSGLVDTAMVRKHGFAVEEIPGGCFCCKFNSLVEASERLTQSQIPDAFIAEPVGSCTDLVASVSYPLRRIYGDRFTIAPLSVLVDPVRARRILGLEAGAKFSPKVCYVYEKQLEEADIIAINKCDLLQEEQIAELKNALNERFHPERIVVVSAREEIGLSDWFDYLLQSEMQSRQIMDLDYDLYADGEALLGWFNATVNLSSGREFDGNQLTLDFARSLHQKLNDKQLEIAHLKMTLSPLDGFGDITTVNLVRNDHSPEISESLKEPVEQGQLIINLRAEGDADQLHDIVTASIQEWDPSIQTEIEHTEYFQPAKPNPTHRITEFA